MKSKKKAAPAAPIEIHIDVEKLIELNRERDRAFADEILSTPPGFLESMSGSDEFAASLRRVATKIKGGQDWFDAVKGEETPPD